jgi:replicative DNA helicase
VGVQEAEVAPMTTTEDPWVDAAPHPPEPPAEPASTGTPAPRRPATTGQTDTTRTPPHDLAAERAVLGAVILRPDLIHHVGPILGDDDWHLPAHRTLWEAITDLDAASTPVDEITLWNHLQHDTTFVRAGGALLIHSTVEAVTAPDAATYYAQIVADRAAERATIALGTWLTQAGHGAADPAAIRERLEQHLQHQASADRGQTDPRMISAGTWLFDHPDTVDALWGTGDDVLWARGETLLIAGPSGVGKTTIGQQLALARLGLAKPDLLNLPIEPAERGLYLAMDRPAQARRSLRRMLSEADRPRVEQALTVWKGPPPQQVIANPRVLLELAHRAGLRPGDFVVVDSVKDVAIGIAKDDVGSAVNMALQELLAADIDVLALHHIRKADHASAGKEPATIDELYGSSHIVNGAGSVISIWGAPGDPIVSFKHMKQPASPLGPWRLIHDPDHGRTRIWHEVDLLQLVRGTGTAGLTAQAAAHTLYAVVDGKPTQSQQEKARRRLEKYVTDGLIVRHGGSRGRSTDGSDPARYYLAARIDQTTGEIT